MLAETGESYTNPVDLAARASLPSPIINRTVFTPSRLSGPVSADCFP